MADVPTVVTLPSFDPILMRTEAAGALAEARAIEIDSDSMYEIAGEELQAVKKRGADLEAKRKSITGPLDEAKKSIMDLFRPAQEFCDEAEGVIKVAMVAYKRKQEQIALEARIEQERLAKIESERVEALAKEARERAAALRLEAANAETMDAESETLDKAYAAEQQAAEFEASISVTPVATIAPAPKAKGVSMRDKWSAECTDKLALLKHVLERPELVHLLIVDQSALNKMASAQKDAFRLPGVRLLKGSIIAARKAA